jgi:hypothetical protein
MVGKKKFAFFLFFYIEELVKFQSKSSVKKLESPKGKKNI